MEEYPKSSEELNTCESKSIERCDCSPSDGPKSSSPYVWIEITIPEVVDGAACSTHDEGTAEEEEGCAED